MSGEHEGIAMIMQSVKLPAAMLALLLALTPLLSAATTETAADQGLVTYIMVLKNPRLSPKVAAEPDLSKFGGRELQKWRTRRVVALPEAAVQQLRDHPAVKYLQPVASGSRGNASAIFAAEDSLPPEELRPELHWSGPTWFSGEYRYDGAGNIKSIGAATAIYTDAKQTTNSDGKANTYVYDSAGRLVEATVNHETNNVESYDYDSFGNRVKVTTNGVGRPIAVSSLTNRTDGAEYDVAGNQQSAGGERYIHDAFNRMRSKLVPDGVEFYIYTADDERIGVDEGTAFRWTIRDFEGKVLREYESSSWAPEGPWLWVEDYVYSGGKLTAAEREPAEGGRVHFHLDHLGTPRLITKQSGLKVALHDYYAFGVEQSYFRQEMTDFGHERPEPRKFTSHERDFANTYTDTAAALDYMHARYYSPALGRFLSVDPGPVDAAYPQTWNRYSYALNNPLKYIDPTGEIVDLAGLSSQERNDLLLSLNAFTGNEYGVNNNGELTVINYGNGASSTATQFLDDAIGATNTYTVNAANNSKYVNLMDSNTTTGQIRVDFADFANTNMKGLPKEAFHLGENLFHELVHTHFRWIDPHEAGQGPTATDRLHINGPVVDFTNRVHAERGLPLRGPTYAPQDSTRTTGGRVRVPFIDPRTGRTVYVFPRLRP